MSINSDDIYGLILSALYGLANEQQEQQLVRLLESDPQARKIYVDFLLMYTHLHRRKGASLFLPESDDSILNENAWEILAHQEKTAEAVVIERPAREIEEPQPQKIEIQKRVSKFSIYSLILSSAALLFIIAYAHFALVRTSSLVGKLTRTVDAQWQDASGQIAQGCDLYPGPMSLTNGYAEIVLEGGATVVVQAPCRFTLESPLQLFLQEGQVVALMKAGAKQAFVVRTPHASVVDYGTEFGVKVDAVGQTETYVYEGLVQLRDSSDPIKFMKSLNLKAGQGAAADPDSKLTSKKINPMDFVRPEELDVRYQAQKNGGYYRWRQSIYRLHRDPSLVAHYFFEKQKDTPQRLINAVFPDLENLQGTFGNDGRNSPDWTRGRWPQKDAVRFERGKDQVIVIPPDPSLAMTSPLTISVWVCFPDPAQWGGHLISCREKYSINYQFSLFDENYAYNYQKNRFEFRQYEGSGGSGFYSRPFVPEVGQWYHLAVVYNGSDVRFYVNGTLFQAAPYKGLPEEMPAEIIIGAMKIEGYVLEEGDFDGIVDELMLFNRSVSEPEIRAIYETGKP